MRTKKRPLFGVTEFFNDDSLPRKNFISYVYIQEEEGNFNRVLYGRNRLAKRIIKKKRKGFSKKKDQWGIDCITGSKHNGLSKAQGSKLGLLKKKEQEKNERHQKAQQKGQQKMRKYVQGKSVYTEKQLEALTSA